MFRVSGFGYRVLSFGFRVLGLVFRVSGFRSKVSGVGPPSPARNHDTILRRKAVGGQALDVPGPHVRRIRQEIRE